MLMHDVVLTVVICTLMIPYIADSHLSSTFGLHMQMTRFTAPSLLLRTDCTAPTPLVAFLTRDTVK